MSGVPPFGAALYSRLSAAREARDRSSPSRVTIADAFLPPQLAAWQAVWRGHPPSRLQGALSMKASGSIGLGNKRAGAPGKPGPSEIAVDIDRKTVSSAIRSFSTIPPTPPPATTSLSASAPNTKPTSIAMAR